MYRRLLIVLSLFLICLVPAAQGQDDENPTIAIMRLGRTPLNEVTRIGILDMLQAYQMIDADERVLLNQEEDLEGTQINVIWGDAGMDLATANIMVENALDRGADILLPLTTPVAQITANLTEELDQPPLVLFSIVSAPYSAGIAQAPCIKRDHIAGTQAQIPYERIVSLAPLQVPDIKTVGTLVNPAESTSLYGMEQLVEHGEALGLSFEIASVASLSDIPVASQSLMDKNIEALLLTGGSLDIAGLPAIMDAAAEYGVPVFGSVVAAANRGAHVGAGFHHFYREGVIVGRMLVAHLEGNIDVSTLAINALPSIGIALNLDAAEEAGITFSDDLLAMADYVIADGQSTQVRTPPNLPDMPLDERRAADLEFLAGLECTEEMIAEQQAALDTASK